MTKKIAIVCGSPSSEFLAPYDDETWEIWVLGNRAQRYMDKRITRIFEIHDNLTEHSNPEEYTNWLAKLGKPLIVGEQFPIKGEDIEVFPYEAVEKLYGSLYLTASPAYMMAYAILVGASEIGLYGVDLSISDHEYFWQRPCVEAWIGFAKGRGIKVTIPEVSHIGKSSYVEGRDWNGNRDRSKGSPFSECGFNIMAEKHNNDAIMLQEQRRELALKAAMHDGAKQVYENLAKVARAIEAKVDVKSLNETTIIK